LFDIHTKQNIGCGAVPIIFGCLSLVVHDVTTGFLKKSHCRQLVYNFQN